MKHNIFLFIVFLFLFTCASQKKEQIKLLPFEKDNLWGYKNAHGEVVIEAKYYIAQYFSSSGIAAVADSAGWSLIDMKGNIKIRPYIFDNGPDYFKEGVARFVEKNKFGFFNEKAKITIEPQFDFALPFQEGLAVVCVGCKEQAKGEHRWFSGGKWGYINHKGKFVIPLKFEEAKNFKNNKARVMFKNKWAYINKKGVIVE